MLLHIADLSGEPLHSQISQQILGRILTGDLKEGARLMPAPAFARAQRVSVHTVERAYNELVRQGLITRKPDEACVNPLSAAQREAFAVRYSLANATDRTRWEDELATARQIQVDLLPKELPNNRHFSVMAFSSPSRVVGGDFYDCFPVDHERMGLVIGDASGKGFPAALLISQIQAMIKSEVSNGNDIGHVLQNMNNQLAQSSGSERFATLFYGIFDRQSHRFEYANAGHNAPVVMRRDGAYELLEKGGLLLGGFPGAQYPTIAVVLEAGDSILLYTDGLTEAVNWSDQEYGQLRLLDTLTRQRHDEATGIVDAALEDLAIFQQGKPPGDDLTVMVLKVNS